MAWQKERRWNRYGALLAMGLVFGGLTTAAGRELEVGATEPPIRGFQLHDQHGTERGLQFPLDQVAVLLIADRRGSDQLEGWVRPLYERYGEAIRIEGVAQLKRVPRPLRGLVSRLFRDRIGYPVLLDWSGEVSEQFESSEAVANVFVIERDGDIPLRLTGEATAARLSRCYEQIDGLLEPGARPEAP